MKRKINLIIFVFFLKVHRDMKPANLVFFGPTLKIVDLGIAQKVVAG